jgi:titin
LGTDATGAVDLGNTFNGVTIDGAARNIIGGTTDGERNIISGNDGPGVVIADARGTSSSQDNIVQGNYIGTDVSGTTGLGNFSEGILLLGDVSANTIGANVISGNLASPTVPDEGYGILLKGSSARNNVIRDNIVGLDWSGTAEVPNQNDGVRIEEGPGNELLGNVISGNDGRGVLIRGFAAKGNVLEGNRIGSNALATAARANRRAGVRIEDAPDNIVGFDGGDVPAICIDQCNLISGNGALDSQGVPLGGGIEIVGAGAAGNQIVGNYKSM